MNAKEVFMVVLFANINLTGVIINPTHAQTPTTSDLPMTTINETNSTVDVLNKTLPVENATKVVPPVPM